MREYVRPIVLENEEQIQLAKKNIDEINKHLIRRGGKEQNGICN